MTQIPQPTTQFRIAIGSAEAAFIVLDTNAPQDYDGFGTFTASEYNGDRTVLVRAEHLNWQTLRYSSGNKWWRPTEHDITAVTEHLWNRVRGEAYKI
jgi:hypothetical protein